MGTSDAGDVIEVYRSAGDAALAATFLREEWTAKGYRAEARPPTLVLGGAAPAPRASVLILDGTGQAARTRPRPVKRLKASDRLSPALKLKALVASGVVEGADWEGERLVGASCLVEHLPELLGSAAIESLRTLAVEAEEEGDWARAATLLGKKAPASLRELTLCTFDAVELFDETKANPTKLLGKLTQLESASLHAGQLRLDPLGTCGLTRLELCAGALLAQSFEALAATTWPRLSSLGLWVGAKAQGSTCTVDGLARLLAAPGFASLRELALHTCEFGNAAAEAVLASPLLPQLERLELSQSVLDDQGVAALVREASRLRHLKAVVLDEVRATPAAIEALRQAGVTVASAKPDALRFETVAQFVPLT